MGQKISIQRFLNIRKERLVMYIMIISFLFLLVWIIPNMGKVFIVILLIGFSILLGLYRRILPFYLGLELLTFTTVVTCYLISPFFAFIAALIMLSAQAIMTGHITIHYFMKIGIYLVVVLLCSLFPGMEIAQAGKIMTVFINVSYIGINILLGDAQGLMDTPGNIINIFLNFWLFSKASGVLELMM